LDGPEGDSHDTVSVGGWSYLLSSEGDVPAFSLPQTSGWAANSVSSIELVSADSMNGFGDSPSGGAPPEIIVYMDTDFTGPEVTFHDGQSALPKQFGSDRSYLNWNNNISSMVQHAVARGLRLDSRENRHRLIPT